MHVGVIHDFGVNRGGGDLVMLNILEALDSAGHHLTVITSKPAGIWETSKLFDRKVHDVKIRQVRVPALLHHPYTMAYIARRIAKSNSHDVFILSDDVPKCLGNRRVVCYVHYPQAARFIFKEYVAKKYRQTVKGKIAWWVHRQLFPRFYAMRQVSSKWLLIANSAVTMKHISGTFHLNPQNAALLDPPVASVGINTLWKRGGMQKEDLVVCIGRFEPSKRSEDLLRAIVLLKDELDFRSSIIGFSYDESYLRELTRTVRGLGLENDVDLLPNARREVVLNELLRAKALVHCVQHEPFGMVVVEGMAAGCIPIVRKGSNGPWTEITQEGEYGFGFETVEEMADALRTAIEDYENVNTNRIACRALEFDENMFKTKFLEVFGKSISQG